MSVDANANGNVNFTVCGECSFTDMVMKVKWCDYCGLCPNCCHCAATDVTVKCEKCGSDRFVYYQTITEAANVKFNNRGEAVVGDAKWETTDAHHSEIRCSNGHELTSTEDGPWTGDVV